MTEPGSTPAKHIDRRVGDVDVAGRICLVTGGGSGKSLKYARRGTQEMLYRGRDYHFDLHLPLMCCWILHKYMENLHVHSECSADAALQVSVWPSLGLSTRKVRR